MTVSIWLYYGTVAPLLAVIVGGMWLAGRAYHEWARDLRALVEETRRRRIAEARLANATEYRATRLVRQRHQA